MDDDVALYIDCDERVNTMRVPGWQWREVYAATFNHKNKMLAMQGYNQVKGVDFLVIPLIQSFHFMSYLKCSRMSVIVTSVVQHHFILLAPLFLSPYHILYLISMSPYHFLYLYIYFFLSFSLFLFLLLWTLLE